MLVRFCLQQSSYEGDFARELERVGAGVLGSMTPDDDCVVPNLRRVPSVSDMSEEGSLGEYSYVIPSAIEKYLARESSWTRNLVVDHPAVLDWFQNQGSFAPSIYQILSADKM